MDQAAINTPDQRVRVFVSSTLEELAGERRAVSRAITSLRLTPVMFELGASPHAPQELYRAYLAQSDVFVGLYWQRYGQVGASMEISGLEDELELARGLPRLLYVKTPAPEREARLTDLLSRIKREASYRTFQTPTELARLVREDLATLLSERFVAGRAGPPPPVEPQRLPVAATALIGREQAVDDVVGLIARGDARLVTLTGPGGVGKTRLAVAVGERLRDRFEATVLVGLADATRPVQVLRRVGQAVGADPVASDSPLQTLVERLNHTRWLLILDNLESVPGTARDLAEVLALSPGVAMLATSQMALQVRGEREYAVAPLPLPADPAVVGLDEVASAPAVALFVERARAVRPSFALSEGNAEAVAEICRRLEGLPLAIELAAVRTRLLTPQALLRRLTRSLDALGSGAVDLPERQHTLRATVEWSIGLLADAERSLLEIASVFVDGWTIEAVAGVAGLDEDRAFELTEALAGQSLIYVDVGDRGPRSWMLETIRAFAAERLAARPDAERVRRRHAEHFRAFAEQADLPLRGVAPSEWMELLGAETGKPGGRRALADRARPHAVAPPLPGHVPLPGPLAVVGRGAAGRPSARRPALRRTAGRHHGRGALVDRGAAPPRRVAPGPGEGGVPVDRGGHSVRDERRRGRAGRRRAPRRPARPDRRRLPPRGCPASRWRGPRRSPTTSSERCARRRPPCASCWARTSPCGRRSPSSRSARWRRRSAVTTTPPVT
jgi:predicted ATPase